MKLYNKEKWWKFLLILGAGVISVFSIFYTSWLTDELRQEEEKKMEIWAEANRLLVANDELGPALNLVLEILRINTTIPIIISDDEGNIILHRNISIPEKNSDQFLKKVFLQMKKECKPFPVPLSETETQYIYFKDSVLLKELHLFPIIQLMVVFVFMAVAYLAFSVARRWEQDQVWVGMARETAHQLGTPTSSLLGWMDVLQLKNMDPALIVEMKKDIQRLQTITDRFSKIGSKPDLTPENVSEVVGKMVEYLRRRSSTLVKFSLISELEPGITVRLGRPLFEWVIENICKNAIDAMEGEGSIHIKIFTQKNDVCIDIRDTGKGMSRSVQKTVFKPGFSTKPKGWGLGLTLARRIVEQYHKGRLVIIESIPGKGTTFRISLPANKID
jgi:two-component sensor histidine kinase